MKVIAIVIGVLVVTVGLVGLINPPTILAVGQAVATPAGLYVVAALRIGIGLVLLLAASASRMPRTLRIGGVVVMLAGVATPIFGVDRSHAVLDWMSGQGSALIRGDAIVAMAVGVFIIYAIGPVHRAGPSLAARH